MTLVSAARLGPYEILGPLGAGGMGEVYRATDTRLGRTVALKVLPEGFLEGEERRQRFEREARTLASLNHPNVAVLYSFEEIPGSPPSSSSVPILTMELLEGETLREKLGAPLSPRKAIEYALQVAHGLAAAHEKGIVHRDLKPENLFVTRDGRIKILDFGIAKLTQPSIPSISLTEAPTETPATGAGVVLGTVGYMSPEQVLGKPLDARTDLFSLGVVLYEMLAGKRPFQKQTAPETLAAILREEPPELSEINVQVPPGLDRIVRHCLEKDPGNRFQSARDVAFAFESLSEAVTGRTAALALGGRHRIRRTLPIALAAAALVSAIPLAFVAGRRTARPEPPTFKRLTFRRGLVGPARFAPDGQTVVYSARWEGKPEAVFSKRPESPDALPVDLPNARLLAISAAGELAIQLNLSLAHPEVSRGTLARVALTGGTPREVSENVNQADWGPDGNLVVARDADGKGRLEYPIGKVLYETAGYISSPRFSPRRDLIAFAEHPVDGDDRGSVAVVDLRGRKRTLSKEFMGIRGVAWSPSGDEVWFAGSATGESHSLWGVSLGGTLRAVARVPGFVFLRDVSPSGRVLLNRVTWLIGIRWLAPGYDRERDLTWLGGTMAMDLSPDGKTVLAQEQGEGVGRFYAVCVWRMDGSPVKLGEGYAGQLSPDGKWATTIRPDGLAFLQPTGPGESRRLEIPGLVDVSVWGWFPDSRRVLVAGKKDPRGPERFFVQDLERGVPRPVTPDGVVGAAAVSPDGGTIAVASPEKTIALYPAAGGDPRPVPGAANGDSPVQWAADGRSLYVRPWAAPTRLAAIFRIDLQTGKRELWKELTPDDPVARIIRVRLARDGRSYAYTYEVATSDLYLVEGLR